MVSTKSAYNVPFCVLLLLLTGTVCYGQAGGGGDAGGNYEVGRSYIRLPSVGSTFFSAENGGSVCEETYGFLPCTTSVLGNLFLILVYGYLMFLAATFLSDGSELLLEILGPGIVGGLFLPILGALPDGMLILVSGLSGSRSEAQDQVSVGMGLLAGSTVMLLTVIWGTCILVGKCDMDGSATLDETDTRGFSLRGSGVSTDVWTSHAAKIMAISVLPFLVVQLPQALNSSSGRHLAVLFALVLSIMMLICYCIYQVIQPWIQERKLDYVKQKRVLTGFLKHLLKKHPLERFSNPDGSPNREVLERIFKAIDLDSDATLSKGELKAFVIGMRLEGLDVDEEDIVNQVLKEFDTERPDQKIDLDEFIKGISDILGHVKSNGTPHHNADTIKRVDQFDEETRVEHSLLGGSNHAAGGEDDSNKEAAGEAFENPKNTTIKAIIFLVIGTLIAAAFADPLVDAVDNFSTATSIPSFFISFIFLPLATNSSEAVSAIIFASRKKRRSASLTFSELYGAATMNNVLCLSVFLALVYVRGLTWDFSSEVLVIFLVCVIMGAIGSFRTSFPLWTASIAFILYPFSLVLVYVLDYIFGWS